VRLTFDNPVGVAASPTLGPKAGPITARSVAAVDGTNIDLGLDIHKPVSGIGF